MPFVRENRVVYFAKRLLAYQEVVSRAKDIMAEHERILAVDLLGHAHDHGSYHLAAQDVSIP